MSVLKYTHFLMPCNSIASWRPGNAKFAFTGRRMFTYRYISCKPYSSLLCKSRILSNGHPCTVNFIYRTAQKNLNFQISLCCTFQTSPPRNVHPVIWIVLRPVLKVAAVITGRGIRKWWRSLPKDKKQYLLNELKANRRKIGIALSLILCLSVGYYLSHLELTPITKRRRFMAFTSKQLEKINEFELEKFMGSLGPQMLPPNHPSARRVERVVKRILAANADLKELEGKKFGVSVIDNTVENAFVIPVMFLFSLAC